MICIISTLKLNAQFQMSLDNASNYGGSWVNGNNNGFGFGAWSISTGANTGIFIGNPSTDGMSTTDIGTSAFGLYSTWDGYVTAQRTFDASMKVGDIFTFYWVLNWDANTGAKGFDLRSGATTVFNVNNGGSSTISGSNGDIDTGYGTNTMTVTFERTSSSQYSFSMTKRSDGSTYSTTINSSDAVDRIHIYIGNQNDGAGNRNIYFNGFQITSSSATADLSAYKGFRLLASPASTTASDLLTELWTQGQTTGGNVTNGSSNVWQWDNTAAGRDSSVNWLAITDIGNTTLSGASGILVYDYDDDDFSGSQDNAVTSLSVSGSEKSAPDVVSLNTNADGYSLVGNPFASSISWDQITKSNINATAKVWNPTANDVGSWVDITGTDKIAPFQGFMVQTTAAEAASVTIGTSAKSTGATFYAKQALVNEIKFDLSSGDSFKKSIRLQINDESSNTKDRYDSERFAPMAINYLDAYFAVEDMAFSINSIPSLETQVSIPLHVEFTQSGTVTMNAANFNLPSGYSATLVDHQTGEEMTIDAGFTYQFEHVFANKSIAKSPEDVLKAAKTLGVTTNNRFSVVIGPMTTSVKELSELPNSVKLNQNYPNPFNPSTQISFELPQTMTVKLAVYDVMGREIATLLNGAAKAGVNQVNWNASNVGSGMYYYRLVAGDVSITKKMTLVK